MGIACCSRGNGSRGVAVTADGQIVAPYVGRCTRSRHRGIGGSLTRSVRAIIAERDGGQIRRELYIIIKGRVVVVFHINRGLVVVVSRGLGDILC